MRFRWSRPCGLAARPCTGMPASALPVTPAAAGGGRSWTCRSIGSGWGTTTSDYVQLALGTGGAAWDLNQLRAGGLTAQSFTEAFVDVKVGEIIPEPGAILLLGAGLGLLGVATYRRRRRA